MALGKSSSVFAVAALAAACSPEASEYGPDGKIGFEPARPKLAPLADAPDYTGSNEFVMEAQSLHRTALDLHRNVIVRTCGPTNGVCHNQKEYPDLHTPAHLLEAVNAPCNVQPGDATKVFDGCEVAGDRLALGESHEVEIGWVNYITGEAEDWDKKAPGAESPGLHIRLQSPIQLGDQNRTWGAARFIRTFVENNELSDTTYERYDTAWYLIDGGNELVGQVQEYQVDRINELLATGITQGDMNRNGVFGARASAPFSLLRAGDPEQSYLIGRLRGELKGQKIPGTRMPLANQPLSIADMLGLFCFVEGLPKEINGVYDLDSEINYADCTWSSDPEGLNLLGNGATWLGRVQPLLETNCGGCHGGEKPQNGFDVLSDGLYERLLGNSTQSTTMPFVTPGDPTQSYLWLKLTSAMGMIGAGMPLNSDNMVTPLPEGALSDIQTWIMNGAKANE
jgi:hypothetical protein